MQRVETFRSARKRWGRRLIGTVLSVGGHLALVLMFVHAQGSMTVPQEVEPAPITLTIMQGQPPPGPPAEKPASPPKPPEKKPPKPKEKPTPPKKVVTGSKPVPAPKASEASASESASEASLAELPEGALAGAITAGTGPVGGDCNMPRLLQNALRKDPRAQRAVAAAHRGKALLVWDGSWIRSVSEDGDGLAGLREAIMVEVAFAPAACKTEPVNGRVLLSMGDGAGRVVLGSGRWRWEDLLGRRTYGRN